MVHELSCNTRLTSLEVFEVAEYPSQDPCKLKMLDRFTQDNEVGPTFEKDCGIFWESLIISVSAVVNAATARVIESGSIPAGALNVSSWKGGTQKGSHSTLLEVMEGDDKSCPPQYRSVSHARDQLTCKLR